MKITNLLTILFLLLVQQNLYSQNCSNTSVGLVPINDLGSSHYRGQQGGLYEGGLNTRPEEHNKAGLEFAKQIVPLDTNGNYDPVNGRIVLMSIGMSNCNQEFGAFMTLTQGLQTINPKLRLVNGAQGGIHINLMIDSTHAYWAGVNQKLANAGLTPAQVQAVWYKNAESNPSDTSFPGYPQSLAPKHKTVMNIIHNKFPNVKLCYAASRIYAGYATTTLNPEPFAYYSGWSVKWMIRDQINGDPQLSYIGPDVKSPWICWGPYTWADGLIPRSDGLTWLCPTDFNADGTHPSNAGRMKVGNMLLTFFLNDETSKPWFRRNLTAHLTLAPQGFLNSTGSLNMRDTVLVKLRRAFSPYDQVDSCRAIADSVTLTATLNFYGMSNGRYYLQVIHRNSIETWSRNGGEELMFGGILDYDMTSSESMAYGNNLTLVNSRYCIFSGDVNRDGVIDAGDLSIADNESLVFTSGYIGADVNGDMLVDAGDLSIIDNNAFAGIVSVTP